VAALLDVQHPQERSSRREVVAMIEVRVQSLGLDQSSKSPVVILKESEGERVLPIWIGPGEASAIAMELAGMKFSRPLTHDLAASLIRGLGGVLQRVNITRVQDNTYYAELLIQRGSEVFSVDARPSDSIAIALRTQARIFTTDELLAATAVQMSDIPDADELTAESEEPGEPKMSAEELQEYLRKMNPEDLGRFNP
jgi:bifunctional DNase/RNase